MYVYTYICTYVCMYMYVHMYVCMHVCTCTYARMHACTYICMYVRMHVCTYMYVCMYAGTYAHVRVYICILYQELMKEGGSNCVERHLNLNDCDTSLLWTYSQVGHKCCFHSQRITPHAVRKRTYMYVYIRRWRVAIVNCDSISQRWSTRSKGSESGKPRRHIGLQKDLGYSR